MIFTPLLPHQTQAFKALAPFPRSGLFMELGLGKSLVALKLAEHRNAETVLITSDKNNILNTWVDQIHRHTDWECVVRPTKRAMEKFLSGSSLRPRAVLVNYDLLARRIPMFLRPKWDFWIGDESAEFKDARTLKHKGVWAVCRGMPCVLLNGKLLTEGVEDIWGQTRLIGEMLGRSFYSFRTRFMQKSSDGYGWVQKRGTLSKIRRVLGESCFFHDGEGVRMPETNRILVEVEMTDEQRRLDESLREKFEMALSGIEVEVDHAAAMFIKRIQLCGGVFRHEEGFEEVPCNKLDVVRRIIEENPGEKIVVWHTYIPETILLEGALVGIPCAVVSDSNSSEALERFACNDGPRVALIRTSLCKGLNKLVGASIAIIYSNPLSFARRAQLEGRTRRLTSNADVTHYIDVTCKGGADQIVLGMLDNKQSLSMTLSGMKKIQERC